MYVLLLILAAVLPVDKTPRDSVDIAETNHFYDDCGRLVFTQIIWWSERDAVIAWRMDKELGVAPQRDWRNGGYVSLWNDSGFIREVRSRFVRETFTQHDPEAENRNIVPVEQRRELSKRTFRSN